MSSDIESVCKTVLKDVKDSLSTIEHLLEQVKQLFQKFGFHSLFSELHDFCNLRLFTIRPIKAGQIIRGRNSILLMFIVISTSVCTRLKNHFGERNFFLLVFEGPK